MTLGHATRNGYAMSSWNTAADGTGDSYAPDSKIEMPEGGLTLYAQWEADKCVMRYMYNYPGQGAFRSVTNLHKNSRTTIISDTPTRPASLMTTWVFLGWSTNSNATSADIFPGDTYTTGSEDLTILYAVWGNLADFIDYDSLTAWGEEVTYNGTEQSLKEGVQEVQESSNYPGYAKVGSGTILFVTVDYYAKIDDIKASGTDAGSYSAPITAEIYRLDPLFGMIFEQAYVSITNNVLKIKPVEMKIETKSDEKLYDGEALTAGGTITFGEETAEFDAKPEGGAVTLVNNETLNIRATGSQTEVGQSENTYEVDWGKPDGWGTKATAKRYNYRLAEDGGENLGTLKVYYEIAFDKNCDDDVTVPGNVKAYKEEGDDVAKAELPGDEPSREHYVFKGWAKSADATEADYQPGDEVTVTEDDVTDGVMTLYAVWEIEKHKVTFVDEDGTVLKEATEYDYGTAAADIEKPADPTKAADAQYTYTFAGWDPEIADVTEDATYTATYDKTPIPAPAEKGVITYDLNGGSYDGSTDDIVEEYEVGETITIHEAPEREGYVFQFWKGSEYQPGDSYTVEGDHTFKAMWLAEEDSDEPDDEDEPEDEPEEEETDEADKPASSKGVDTGDAAGLLGLLGLYMASAGGLHVLVRRRRRDDE